MQYSCGDLSIYMCIILWHTYTAYIANVEYVNLGIQVQMNLNFEYNIEFTELLSYPTSQLPTENLHLSWAIVLHLLCTRSKASAQFCPQHHLTMGFCACPYSREPNS